MITRYMNTPLAELERFAEDTGDELALEIIARYFAMAQEKVDIYEEGFSEGFRIGYDTLLGCDTSQLTKQ